MKFNDLVGVDLKPFEALLKLCRKQGVTEITMGDIHIKLGELPRKPNKADSSDEPVTDFITDEQLAFYSVGGEVPIP